ncbi:YebC-like protein [Xylariaceae sp. FL0016]|nr:YebC-like protein [Xylariaceae sp. FL0016]
MSFFFASPLARALVSRSFAPTICAQCSRSYHASASLRAGHNKWSKIKHQKGANDMKKNAQRNTFSKNLTLFSKLYGPDPNMNSSLASVITAAKKAGMPKSTIDIAIARGQGKSSTGQGLESVTLEVMAPPAVAIVIDVETDNRLRALQDLRLIVKKHNATVTPTAFHFTRLGRTVLRAKGEGPKGDSDEILMQALEAGAEDLDTDEMGNLVIQSQPNMTHNVAQTLSKGLGLEILSSDIVWSCAGEKVKLDDTETTEELRDMLAAIQEYSDVQAIYSNAERGAVSEQLWSSVEESMDS